MKYIVSIMLAMIIVISANSSFGQSSDMKKEKSYKVKLFIKKVEKPAYKNGIKYFDAIQKGDSVEKADEIYEREMLNNVMIFLQSAHDYRVKKMKKYDYKRNIVIEFKSKDYPAVMDIAKQRFLKMEMLIFTKQIIIKDKKIPTDDLESIAQPIVDYLFKEIEKKSNVLKKNEEEDN